MNIDFGKNKTPVEIIKIGTFEETYFSDTYSNINNN